MLFSRRSAAGWRGVFMVASVAAFAMSVSQLAAPLAGTVHGWAAHNHSLCFEDAFADSAAVVSLMVASSSAARRRPLAMMPLLVAHTHASAPRDENPATQRSAPTGARGGLRGAGSLWQVVTGALR